MPHLPDKISTNPRCSPSRGSLDPVPAGVHAMASLDSPTSLRYPRCHGIYDLQRGLLQRQEQMRHGGEPQPEAFQSHSQ
jgi:hypothetical protein